MNKISDWISKNYSDNSKIIEVGVGNTPTILIQLRKKIPDCKLIGIDVKKIEIPQGIIFVKDDIKDPNLNIYENSDLIYSIRPPLELHKYLFKISKETNSDLLIKPVSSEETPKKGKLINHSGAAFYLIER